MTLLVQPGDVWRDLDPRGGPTFLVLSVHPLADPPHVIVEALNGTRRRPVLLKRFRRNANYKSGYTLVSRTTETAL